MAADTDMGLRSLFPSAIRSLPTDLAVAIVFVVLTVLSAVLPGVRETPVPVILGLPLVLFVPGYAFVAALFPGVGTNATGDEGDSDSERHVDEGSIVSTRPNGINGVERTALSFGTSIAIVSLIGSILNFTPWGIRNVPIYATVGGFTLAVAVVGTKRRAKLNPDNRFAVPYERWITRGREELFEPNTQADFALNILVVMALLIALGGVGYAVTIPQNSGSFTEFYILTENETGELVADEYPTEFVAGEPKPLIIGVGNQEYKTTSYTVVVEIQRVETQDNTTTVLESESLRRFSPTIEDSETWQQRHQVAPTMTGERLRLTYLLYRGDPPSDPTMENAYREVHLWVDVAES